MRKCFLAFLFVVLAALPLAASAADGGWGLPNLNPFAGSSTSKAKPPTSTRVSDGSSGWQMPSLLPSGRASRRPAGLSTWQRMSSGTKSFFSKTADVLTPWDNAKEEKPVVASGRGSTFNSTANRKPPTESTGSWLTSWWTVEEETPRPKTVSDFLAQPRPEP
jgi:hypothetical protein